MRTRIFIIVALLLLSSTTMFVLFYTPLGVSLAASQLHVLERKGIRIEGLAGRLAGPLSVRRLELDLPRVRVVASDIEIDLQELGLLVQTVRTDSLSARDVEVTLRAVDSPPSRQVPRFLPSSLRIDARGVRLQNVRYVHVDGRSIEADEVSGHVTISPRRLHVRQFAIAAERFAADGSLRLMAARPLRIALDAKGTIEARPDLSVALQAKLGGTVDRMTIEGTIDRPSAIAARGLLVREEEEWRLTGTVSSPAFSLAPWLAQPPFSFADIALEIELERDEIRATGRFSVPEYGLEQVGIDAHGQVADRTLHVRSSVLTLPDSQLKLYTHGSLAFEGGPPRLSLTARWSDLQWPLRDTALLHSAQGQAEVRGALPYDFKVQAEVTGPKIPAARGTVSGVIDEEALSISSYDIELLNGRAIGEGKLTFGQPRKWSLHAVARDLDIGALHPQLPGRIGFEASATGMGLDRKAAFELAVSSLHGRLRGQPLRASGALARSGDRVDIRRARIAFGSSRLALDAWLADEIAARWSLSTRDLGDLVNDASGAVTFRGNARGRRDTPYVSAHLNARAVRYRDWSAARLSFEGEVDVSNTEVSRVSLNAERIGYGKRVLDSLQAHAEGTLLDHRIRIDAHDSASGRTSPHAYMELDGTYERRAWTARIRDSRVTRDDPAQALEIAEAASVLVARDRAALTDLCYVIAHGRLCARGEWRRGGRWEAAVSGYEIPLAMVLPSPKAELEYAGRIEGSAHAFGAPGQPWQGEAGMKISDAAIIYRPPGAEPERLNLGTGGMHLVALPERITLSFGVQAFTDTFLHTNLQLARDGSNDLLSLPLTGDLRARAADANLLPLLFPEIDRAAGVLTATAQVHGTLAAPELNGRIELSNAELDSYRTNFALRDLDLVARIDGNHLSFAGAGNAGEGRLEVDGNLRWRNGASSGQMRLRGRDLLIADLPEYRIVASPDLRFEIDGNDILVRGDVLIPSARVQPARLSGAVQASSDARYVGEHPAEREGRFRVNSEVRVQMGDDVRVDAFGLHARIEGGVTTNIRTGAATTGRGELRVAEGRYEAYGQQLEINRGQLLFDNAPLEDPGLDIEARRRIDTVTVGLHVRGTLRSPRLTLFSDPSMPHTQIVSYLLVGKSVDSATVRDTDTPDNSLALQGGGFLASQLGRRLGLEEVGIENYVTAEGHANPSLVLGKFLSPRLFISYGISLTESINTLKLRYTLSDHWVLRTESGEAQSADLEYTIER